jgi:hypothetical protein
VMSSVEPGNFGVASATIATMRMTGQMFSMGVATLALASHVGRVKVTSGMAPQLLGGLHTSLPSLRRSAASGCWPQWRVEG